MPNLSMMQGLDAIDPIPTEIEASCLQRPELKVVQQQQREEKVAAHRKELNEEAFERQRAHPSREVLLRAQREEAKLQAARMEAVRVKLEAEREQRLKVEAETAERARANRSKIVLKVSGETKITGVQADRAWIDDDENLIPNFGKLFGNCTQSNAAPSALEKAKAVDEPWRASNAAVLENIRAQEAQAYFADIEGRRAGRWSPTPLSRKPRP